MCATHSKVNRKKCRSLVLNFTNRDQKVKWRTGLHDHCSLLRRDRHLSVLHHVQQPLGPHPTFPLMVPRKFTSLNRCTQTPINGGSYRELWWIYTFYIINFVWFYDCCFICVDWFWYFSNLTFYVLILCVLPLWGWRHDWSKHEGGHCI